jgi:TRAP-type mannitol/chloroaromatic compound transport system permease small subunit
VGLIEGTHFTMNSFAMGETSPDPGGLPARYLIKAAMPVGFLLLGLQGISEALKNFSTIISNER